MRHSLATARVQLDIMRLVLSYGHLSLIASVIVVSVGTREAVAHPADRLGWGLTGLLFGGTALYLATFGFTRWAMFRLNLVEMARVQQIGWRAELSRRSGAVD